MNRYILHTVRDKLTQCAENEQFPQFMAVKVKVFRARSLIYLCEFFSMRVHSTPKAMLAAACSDIMSLK